MNITICDYPDALEADYSLTIQELHTLLGNQIHVDIFPWEETPGFEDIFVSRMQNTQGLITGFLPMTASLLARLPQLKCISVSASGYGNIDLEQAKKQHIKVCHIYEYCTNEVAEHTLALILGLCKQLKPYGSMIEDRHQFAYHQLPPVMPLYQHTLAIFGLGKIGQAVAKRALAFGMHVIAYDPWISEEVAKELGVTLVSEEEALSQATIISNHMLLTPQTRDYFHATRFKCMQQKPLFINVGRGAQVVEADLIQALDLGLIAGAGLDVLSSENPQLEHHPLLHRPNVLLTPHAAFYSSESMKKLQQISAQNLAFCLLDQDDRANRKLN